MRAADLDEAIRWQNQPAYGLTAGLQALDPREIAHWRGRVQAGQPVREPGHHRRHRSPPAVRRLEAFGGRPGAKAGGPNYVASLGTWPRCGRGSPPGRTIWPPAGGPGRDAGPGGSQLPSGPRPTPSATAPCGRVAVCAGARVDEVEVACARAAAAAVGVTMGWSARPRWSPGPWTSTRSGCSGRWPIRLAWPPSMPAAGWTMSPSPPTPAGSSCAGSANKRSAKPCTGTGTSATGGRAYRDASAPMTAPG